MSELLKSVFYFLFFILRFLIYVVSDWWVSRSYIYIEWRERGGLQKRFVLAKIVGSKNKSIYLWDFKDVEFNFTHFANFKFAYFEIEVSFGLIWVKLQNGRFHLQISILGT